MSNQCLLFFTLLSACWDAKLSWEAVLGCKTTLGARIDLICLSSSIDLSSSKDLFYWELHENHVLHSILNHSNLLLLIGVLLLWVIEVLMSVWKQKWVQGATTSSTCSRMVYRISNEWIRRLGDQWTHNEPCSCWVNVCSTWWRSLKMGSQVCGTFRSLMMGPDSHIDLVHIWLPKCTFSIHQFRVKGQLKFGPNFNSGICPGPAQQIVKIYLVQNLWINCAEFECFFGLLKMPKFRKWRSYFNAHHPHSRPPGCTVTCAPLHILGTLFLECLQTMLTLLWKHTVCKHL